MIRIWEDGQEKREVDAIFERAIIHAPKVTFEEEIARLTDSAPPLATDEESDIVVVCAWCPDYVQPKDVTNISHGICPACARKMSDEIDRIDSSSGRG